MKRGIRALTPPKASDNSSSLGPDSHTSKKRKDSWRNTFSLTRFPNSSNAPSSPGNHSSARTPISAPSTIPEQYSKYQHAHHGQRVSVSSSNQQKGGLVIPRTPSQPTHRDGLYSGGNDTLHVGEASQLHTDSDRGLSKELVFADNGNGELDARGLKRVNMIQRLVDDFGREVEGGAVVGKGAQPSSDVHLSVPLGSVSGPSDSAQSRKGGSRKSSTRGGDEQMVCPWADCTKGLMDKHRLKLVSDLFDRDSNIDLHREHSRRNHVLCWQCKYCNYLKGDKSQIDRHCATSHPGMPPGHTIVAGDELTWYRYCALAIRGVNIAHVANARTVEELVKLTGVKPPTARVPPMQPSTIQPATIETSQAPQSISYTITSATTPASLPSPNTTFQKPTPPQYLLDALFSFAQEMNISVDLALSHLQTYVEQSVSSQASTPMSAITPGNITFHPTDSPSPQTTRSQHPGFRKPDASTTSFGADSSQSSRFPEPGRNSVSLTSLRPTAATISPAALARNLRRSSYANDMGHGRTVITAWNAESDDMRAPSQGPCPAYREHSVMSTTTSASSERITTPSAYPEQSSLSMQPNSPGYSADLSMGNMGLMDPTEWEDLFVTAGRAPKNLALPEQSYVNANFGAGFVPEDNDVSMWGIDNMNMDSQPHG